MAGVREHLQRLETARDEARAKRQAILDRAESEQRKALTKDEATAFHRLGGAIEELEELVGEAAAEVERAGLNNPDASRIRQASGRDGGGPRLAGPQLLTREQSIADWSRDNGHVQASQQPVSFDRYIKGIAVGDWTNAREERVMSEGTNSAGGFLVPLPLASFVLDLARNASRVVQAGAITVPMTSQTLKVARLTGEPAPAWRAENAPVTVGDLVFDAVTFTARSLDKLVILSRELLEDSDPSAGNIIAHSFAEQLALEIDRVALRGSGTAPEPRGVLATAGITTTAHTANGAAITNYDWFLDAVGAVANANYEANAHIVAPRTITSLAKLKEATTNAYLVPPSGLLPMLPTRQIPINLTTGTSNDTSEIYTGQWNQLAIGIRTGFELQVLRERYADNQQIGFMAHLRADIQVFQPTAFTVDVGVRA